MYNEGFVDSGIKTGKLQNGGNNSFSLEEEQQPSFWGCDVVRISIIVRGGQWLIRPAQQAQTDPTRTKSDLTRTHK